MNTEDRKVQLGATVDTTEAKKGFKEIKDAGKDMAQSVEASGKRAGEGVKAVGDSAQGSSDKISRAEKSIIGSIERSTAALKAGGKAGADYYEMLARQRGVSTDALKPYLDQLRQAEAAQAAGTASLGKMGASAAQTAAAMRMVPAQFTDIVVSLQSGQAPMTVLLQQGGQLKDMFGGIGAAARGLGGYVLGLVNPYTVAAAAAGALALAYYKGSQETDAFNRAVIMSGNVAGVTASQMAIMARNIDAVVGTQAQASDALAQIAATGKVASENMQRLAETAIRLERDAGVPIENTVKNFEDLGKSPVEASLKLTEQHSYLTLEVYKQIKALQEQGRELEAGALAQKTFADAMDDRSRQLEQSLGFIQRAWRAVKDTAREAWDEILGIGRPAGPGEAAMPMKAYATLAGLFPALTAPAVLAKGVGTALRSGVGALFTSQDDREADAETRRLAARADTANAENKRAFAENEKRKIAAQQRLDDQKKATRSRADQRADEIKQLDRDAKAVGLSKDEYDKRVASINEKYKDPKKGGTGIGAATRRLDLRDIQNDMREELAMVDAQQRALELRRQGGLISEAEYYAKRADLVKQGTEIEKKALTEQLDRLEEEKVKGKEALEVQRQISDVKSKLKLAEINGQNKLNEVNQQAEMAEKKRAAALAQLTLTHDRYVESLERRSRREIASVGMSDRERSYASGRDSIEDRYLADRRKLEDQKMFAATWSPDDEALYKRRIELLEAEQRKELELWDQTFAGIAEAQTKWENGAVAGLKNYADQAADVAGQVKDAVGSAFKGLEDTLVEFVTKGKADFKSLVNSILADIARIAVKQYITGPLAQGLSSALGGGWSTGLANAMGGNSLDNFLSLNNAFGTASGGGFWSSLFSLIPGKASGGPVSAGRLYQVNEREPELLSVGNRTMLMMGAQDGRVTPSAAGQSRQVNHFNFTVGDVATVSMVREAVQQSQRQAAGALRRSQGYGGMFG